jgi:hypothetical protein
VGSEVLKSAARLMMSMGIALLVMALLVRLAEPSRADMVGDDLAVAASAALAALGALVARYGPD